MKIEIKSLRVVNCGPLKDVEIDFTDQATGKPRQTTLLAGANGSGKTTVLELIVELANIIAPTDPFGYRIDDSRNKILARAEFAQIDWLVDSRPFSVILGQLPSDFKWPSECIGVVKNLPNDAKPMVEMTLSRCRSGVIAGQLEAAVDEQRKQIMPSTSEEATNSLAVSPVPSILYMPHHRHLTNEQGTRIEQENTTYEWIYRIGPETQYKGSLNSYLIWLEYSEPETYNTIRTTINHLYSNKKIIDIIRKRLKVIVRTDDGGQHDLERLSSGEQNLLIMLIELRRRLLPNSIVLIDEIENSLHPAFQYRIGEALKALQQEVPFQLIVTSHAPAFLEIFGAKSTLILTEF